MTNDDDKNKLAQFEANPDYDGTYEQPKSDTVTLRYYAEGENLKLDVQNGDIDVALMFVMRNHRAAPTAGAAPIGPHRHLARRRREALRRQHPASAYLKESKGP